MKQRMIAVLIACAAVMASNPEVIHAQVDISANVDININSPSDFYQPLEPYGSWVTVGSYGRCWRPREITADWQPYTDGHWEWTDAGWYWVSDQPWGWACFHYGSWYDAPEQGWVWIPGTEWAPAWVTWRYSDDYIGWAPCGPGRAVLGASFFTFVDVHRFRDHFHNRRDLIVNNTTIINRTKVINDFHRQSVDFDGHQRTVFANRGPGVDPIRRATGKDFTTRPVRDVIRETRQPETLRNDQRQGQRPATQPQREAIPPTGRDEQRNYQQNPQLNNREQRQDQTPPIYQTPQQQQQQRAQPDQKNQPETRPSQTPERRPDVTPPTGREQPRIYREPAKPEVPTPEPRKEVPTPPERPAAPAERPLPPTGRDEARPPRPERPTPPAQAPEARPAPPVRPEPVAPPARTPDDGRGRDGRDRNNP